MVSGELGLPACAPLRISTVALALFMTICVLVCEGRTQTVNNIYSFNASNSSQFPNAAPTQGRDGKLYGTTTGLNLGSIFNTTTSGNETELLALDATNGSNPYGSMTLGNDGNFYGTTTLGGSSGNGVLFKVTPSGTYTVLHEFAGGPDGSFPFAPPIQASDGNFYGTTSGNGGGIPTVYRFTPSTSTFSTIYEFDGTHGANVIAALIQATDGNLYGTAQFGGKYNCGTAFKMNRSGAVLLYYSFPCAPGGALPSTPLVQASDGNFYGTTQEGGSGSGQQGNGTVFKMNQKGKVSTLYRFPGGTVNVTSVSSGLVQGTDGNLYGTTAAGGTFGLGTLYQITTAGVYKLLYSFPQNVGTAPEGGVLQHTDGVFYGTAFQGGVNGYGSVYSLNMNLPPFITFVRPTGGVGQSAQILGQGFTGTTGITFNGTAAASFTVISDTYLTAVVPSGATTGPVVVTTATGTLTSNRSFRILGGTVSAKKVSSAPRHSSSNANRRD
jgi:uncharacterized repeat protein (TIGR03803 family)